MGSRRQGRRVWATEAGPQGYAAISPNVRTETLVPIIEEKVKPDSIVYIDMFKAHEAPGVSAFHRQRINHS